MSPSIYLRSLGRVGFCGATGEAHMGMLADDAEEEHLDFHLGVALRLAVQLGRVEVADRLIAALESRLAETDFRGHEDEREAASRMLAESREEVRAVRDRATGSKV